MTPVRAVSEMFLDGPNTELQKWFGETSMDILAEHHHEWTCNIISAISPVAVGVWFGPFAKPTSCEGRSPRVWLGELDSGAPIPGPKDPSTLFKDRILTISLVPKQFLHLDIVP